MWHCCWFPLDAAITHSGQSHCRNHSSIYTTRSYISWRRVLRTRNSPVAHKSFPPLNSPVSHKSFPLLHATVSPRLWDAATLEAVWALISSPHTQRAPAAQSGSLGAGPPAALYSMPIGVSLGIAASSYPACSVREGRAQPATLTAQTTLPWLELPSLTGRNATVRV